MKRFSARTLGIALIISLAINLFVVGAIAVGFLFHQPGREAHSGRAFSYWKARRSLDSETRDKVDAIWREAHPILRTRIRAAGEARREVRRQLRADPLDLKALEASYIELRDRTISAREALKEVLTKVALILNAEQRREYFKQRFGHRYRRKPPPE